MKRLAGWSVRSAGGRAGIRPGLRVASQRLLCLLLLLPAAASARFNYTTNNGAIVITGYSGPGGDPLVVPPAINALPVSGIGNSAFSGTAVISVVIPDTVTNIGDSAFASCWNLQEVVFGSGVASIGNSAFNGCHSLTSIALPDSVTRVGDNAFDHCLSLSTVAMGGGVTTIGASAFASCQSLAAVVLPGTVASIGSQAFANCVSLNSIVIPGAVTNLGEEAFYHCNSLTSVYFQGNAPALGGSVFLGDPVTAYCQTGTIGWAMAASGLAVPMWNPLVECGNSSFGVRTNQFGFSIAASPNTMLVVEASPSLVNPDWIPVSTNAVPSTGPACFSDPLQINCPARFYRVRRW